MLIKEIEEKEFLLEKYYGVEIYFVRGDKTVSEMNLEEQENYLNSLKLAILKERKMR